MDWAQRVFIALAPILQYIYLTVKCYKQEETDNNTYIKFEKFISKKERKGKSNKYRTCYNYQVM